MFRSGLILLFLLSITPAAPAAIDPHTLPAVGYHPGGVAYWSAPYFANALLYGAWLEYAEGEWGEAVLLWDNPQFDADGYPRYLNPGHKLRAVTYALHSDYGNRPPGWPLRSGLARGRVVLTWQGDADIRLHGGTYLAAQSSGSATGRLVNGRRVYRYDGGDHLEWLEVHEIQDANPPTAIRVWLPDPADPADSSLESQLFHPVFLSRLAEAPWGFIRFMDFLETNANPQQDWPDRRRPGHCFAGGVLHPRNPAPGVDWVGGDRGTGVAYEHLVALCNAADKDLWICVPHLATDDFITRLARLIRYGSDGVEPYEGPQPDPVYAPLNPHLRVFVEYSNEIWSGGWSFPQGEWAQIRADALGLSKAQFNARRFCDVWRIFQVVFGGTTRLVRVAAVFTAAEWYTAPFLQEMRTYGGGLSPAVEPDVIAATTYFGNGIQDWAFERSLAAAGSAEPWFFTGEMFDAGGGDLRPVSRPPDDPYWTGPFFPAQIDEAFDEWTRRLLAGDAREGAGPDTVGVGGGFDQWLRELAQTAFPAPKPILAYEGGPSLYTDDRDGGDPRDDGLTTFIEAMNRHPRMRDVYGIHLDMALSKGLWSHVAFTDCGAWGRYGQWGHLEYLDQPLAEAVKYGFLLDWIAGRAGLRAIDDPLGAVPVFLTPAALPVAVVGQAYAAPIETTGGDGGRQIRIVGRSFLPGLAAELPPDTPGSAWVTGQPAEAGLNYLYLRVVDGDGDPAWRTFLVRAVGGPGVLVESDFGGGDPALHLPWMPCYVRTEGLLYSGWDVGPGVLTHAGDHALVWSVNAPADETQATLALAVADGEFLAVILQPPPGVALDLRQAEIRFTVRRLDWHAPRRFALLASPSGFTAGDALFESDRYTHADEVELCVTLPDTEPYRRLGSPVEFRIYGFSGQYGGHRATLQSFRLAARVRPGDTDANGWLDATDLVRLAGLLAGNGLAIHPGTGDVDADGNVNSVDLTLLAGNL